MGSSTQGVVTVKNAAGDAIATVPVNGVLATTTDAVTFEMPDEAVTVTVTFS